MVRKKPPSPDADCETRCDVEELAKRDGEGRVGRSEVDTFNDAVKCSLAEMGIFEI